MKGLFVWVWEDTPGAPVEGADGYLVRAANGNGVSAGNFNFGVNYGRWRNWCHQNDKQIVPWTYLYPDTNGEEAANALLNAASEATEYVADIEQAVPKSVIHAFAGVMHSKGKRIGFTSYPSRQQSMNQGVPFDDCMEVFDYFVPQVYYDNQAREFANAGFAKPVEPAVSPENNNAWRTQVTQYLAKYGTVSVWRYGAPADLNLSGLEHNAAPEPAQPVNVERKNTVRIVSNTQVDTSQPLHNLVLEVGELDAQGDGWWLLNGEGGMPAVEASRLAWVEAVGSDPAEDADKEYWKHDARTQERDGYVLLSVTGGAPNGVALVRVAYYGFVTEPAPAE